MRKLIVLALILSSFIGYSQTTLECLSNYYISANTLPQYITNRNFTGVRATPNGGLSVYLVTPVTYSVSGNFVSLRGNNGAIISVDSRTTTPSFANVNALLQWIGSCNSNLSNPTTSIEEITYGSGIPTLFPTTLQARHFVDITGQEWYFSNFIWWFNGVLKQTAPPASQTVISGITYNYSQAVWLNTTNNTYNRYLTSCNCWKEVMYSNDTSIVRTTGIQNIWGKKIFKDSLIVDNSVNVKGDISTNGVTTTGTATKAAATINGVQLNKTEEVLGNKILDGTSNVLLVKPTTTNITITLPQPSTNMKGWAYLIKKDNNATLFVIILDYQGNVLKQIYSQDVKLKAECNGASWSVY